MPLRLDRVTTGAMRRIVLVACLAACSSKPPKTNGGGNGNAPIDAAAQSSSADGGASSLSEAECNQIIDHAIAVLNDELRASKPEDEWPTEDQIAALRADLAADFMDECRQYDRFVYECMMAAKDSQGFAQCAAEPAP
jgi:small lipoprotein (TIGR04454 family)